MIIRRSLIDPLVYTHVLFVLNVVLYITSHYSLLAASLLCCTCVSFLYHHLILVYLIAFLAR